MRRNLLITTCCCVLLGCGPATQQPQGSSHSSANGHQGGFRHGASQGDESKAGKKKPQQQVQISSKLNNNAGHSKAVLTTISHLPNYIKPKTLYVFDIDETLMYEQGHSGHVGPPKLAELPHTLSIFHQIKAQASNHNQAQGSKIMFLTARCSDQPARANLLGIGISAAPAWLQGFVLPHQNNRGFHDEVFYTCHTSKGTMLKNLLQKISGTYDFDQVVFVDDNQTYVNDVHNQLKVDSKPKSISLHYTGAIP